MALNHCMKLESRSNDPDMLVFDHLNPNERREYISVMVHNSWGLKSIQEEVAKFRVLCANYHQKHTIQQFGYERWPAED